MWFLFASPSVAVLASPQANQDMIALCLAVRYHFSSTPCNGRVLHTAEFQKHGDTRVLIGRKVDQVFGKEGFKARVCTCSAILADSGSHCLNWLSFVSFSLYRTLYSFSLIVTSPQNS